MKKIFIYLVASIAILNLTSCNGKTDKTTATDQQVAATLPTVDEIIANAEKQVDSLVTFEGVCTHACKHGATKIFVMGSDDNNVIRVEAGELGSFDAKCVNSVVEITGNVREDRIDEAYLAQLEAEIKSQNAPQHGNGEAGCESDNAARGVKAQTIEGQIAEYRSKIADRKAKEGKDYLSFYYIEATSYNVKE